MSELILAIGDDNVKFQNLDQSAISLDWSRKAGGRITFGTGETITPGEGTARLGLVLWLDRSAVAAAIKKPEKPSCGLCNLGYAPFNAEGIMWHQVNGRDPFRCTSAAAVMGDGK